MEPVPAAADGAHAAEPTEPAVDWVAEHVRAYVASGGAEGGRWRGAPALLLTTRGRRSGLRRRTALIYGRDGDDFVVVASWGGADRHPAWYLNLAANPEVELQVGAEVFRATARIASDDERPRLWAIMVAVLPRFDSYRGRTDRVIPVVVLAPFTPVGPGTMSG